MIDTDLADGVATALASKNDCNVSYSKGRRLGQQDWALGCREVHVGTLGAFGLRPPASGACSIRTVLGALLLISLLCTGAIRAQRDAQPGQAEEEAAA